MHWDGNFGQGNRKSYSTSVKTDADFIQFVFSAIGKRTTLNTFDRVGEQIKNSKGQNYTRKNIEYIVTITNTSTDITFKGDKRRNYEDKGQMTPYKTKDGFKYCFSVPSTMLILRREGRIFVTGNSGKTTVSNAVTKILIDNLKKSLEQTALSGRASQRLAEVTGKEAKTIHRLLKYNPNEGFLYHAGNQLDTDVVIVDEASMIDTRLFLNLLEAIKTGTKVIVLGDYGQLSSIGLGQVLSSLIQTNIVKVIKLSTVYRQGKTSAINHQAIEIRNGNQLTHRGFEGRLVFGELKDFELIAFTDRDEVLGAAIDEFKKHLDTVRDIMQVQICTATRTKGNSSAYMLNRMIKNLYNPIKEGDKIAKIHLEGDKNYYLTEGDKIIVTKNDYKANIWNNELQDYEEGAIYNGCIGKVFRISGRDVIIDIEGIGYVKIELNNLTNIELGYAVSVFKLQGSQYHTVIIPLDFSAYTLLNRQLVYTAITRASKHCTLVCENNALIKATATNEVNNKHTFLNNFLLN